MGGTTGFEAERCAIFSGYSKEQTDALLHTDGVTEESYRQGEYLMNRDTMQHRIGILQSGFATVERKSRDGFMHMRRLHSGDLFGAASMFSSEGTYVTDIRAGTDCTAFLIPEPVLLEWFRTDDRLLRNYLCYLTGRIRFLSERLDALSRNNVPAKLMTYFLSEAKDGTVRIRSYSELADTLSLSRATMYRALDQLCEEGKILRNNKTIQLLEDTTK